MNLLPKELKYDVDRLMQDLDKLMDPKDLDQLKTNFWQRYHLRFPAELMAGDDLISRRKRELDQFLLQLWYLSKT